MVTNLKEDSFGFSMLMILKKQNQPKKTSYLFIKYLVYLSQMKPPPLPFPLKAINKFQSFWMGAYLGEGEGVQELPESFIPSHN